MKTFKSISILKLFVLVLVSCSLVNAENIQQNLMGNFSAGSVDQWESKEFKGITAYSIIELDGIRVLKAVSNNSASGLFKKQRIDLHKTPYLNWRWRIENRLGILNEQTKSGDDFVARVYVVSSSGLVFWRSRALNYVWASTSPKGKIWPNAFAGDRAIMIALRSSSDKTASWYSEKRNVLNDLKQFVGQDINYIDVLAIMTDTDNSHGSASAYYGDIYFSEN